MLSSFFRERTVVRTSPGIQQLEDDVTADEAAAAGHEDGAHWFKIVIRIKTWLWRVSPWGAMTGGAIIASGDMS